MSRILLFLAFCLPMMAAEIHVSLSSRFIARGEVAFMTITTDGMDIVQGFQLPEIPGVKITSRSRGGFPQRSRTGGTSFAYTYMVSSFDVGEHVIPALKVKVDQDIVSSEPVTFRVLDGKDIPWQTVQVGGETLTYSAFFATPNNKPYVGELQQVDLKIYVHSSLNIEHWDLPEFDRDGVTAWRFEPNNNPIEVSLLGGSYISMSYPSSIAASREGKVMLKNGKVRLVTRVSGIGNYGAYQNDFSDVFLPITPLTLDAKPLPKNAPEGFQNAVGNFSITSSVDQLEVKEGDSLQVNLQVTGSGNLDEITAPILSEPEGWKIYDAVRGQLGEERRNIFGSVGFRQLIRPLERKNIVPAFTLTYFDPKEEIYKTASTLPITLKLSAGAIAAAPQAKIIPAANVPIERMTDILGIVTHGAALQDASRENLSMLWQLVPLILALVLIAAIVRKHLLPRLKPSASLVQKKLEMKELEKSQTDAATFYRQAAHYIEKWLPQQTSQPEVKEILSTRDEICYLPHTAPVLLDNDKQKKITKLLRKLTLLVVFSVACLSSFSYGAEAEKKPEELYAEGRFREAVESWLSAGDYNKLSAQTLYNIGNCCYRMNLPGYAALYYRRALVADDSFAEARQNLKFIERSQGSMVNASDDFQKMLTAVPRDWIKHAIYLSIWVIVLSLLLFPATRRGARIRLYTYILLVLAPIILAASIYAYQRYPNDVSFAPVTEQAVIVAPNSIVYSEASRTSSEVMDASVGSLCKIVQKSDRWTYVFFTTKTMGWIPSEALEPVIVLNKPVIPKSEQEMNAKTQ